MKPLEIHGAFSTAVCYAKIIDETSKAQIRRMCDSPALQGSRLRIMPDVHAGKGCTIGTTMTLTDRVVPNMVGVDIGCGMYTVNLGRIKPDFAVLDEAAHFIPSGMEVWDNPPEPFDLTQLRCFPRLRHNGRLERSLGTLGGGNHFIEVDAASDGTLWLIIHSGSRNLGKQVAEYYQGLAVHLHTGMEPRYADRNVLIAEYKAAGRESEIQSALEQLKHGDQKADQPEDLCWLFGSCMEDYLYDIAVCQRFARRNRELMAQILLERTGLTPRDAFHTIHNYIDTDERILRKGAIAAHAGDRVLIPINMRDGSVLATGRGNPEWNFSAPHGAGRLLSRSAALRQLDLEAYRREMEGVYTTSVNEKTLDEAPMAYKRLSDILDVISDSVDVIEVLKPLYNFKAG